jgi:hypothetical protein
VGRGIRKGGGGSGGCGGLKGEIGLWEKEAAEEASAALRGGEGVRNVIMM